MNYFSEIPVEGEVSRERAKGLIADLIQRLYNPRKVLIVPPDFTRRHSYAGMLTRLLYDELKGRAEIAILPALGTHVPMTESQISEMYTGIPPSLFKVHNWRDGLHRLGVVPRDYIHELSGGKVDYPVACEINKLLVEQDWDVILSVGQVVPHEVAGMANHSKNIFVGTGGRDTINRTHFLGAACGMGNIMGRAENPVRHVFNYMSENFGRGLPIIYLLSVVEGTEHGTRLRGLFCGDDEQCFLAATSISKEANISFVNEPVKKAVVYLDPDEYHSTWLGNKSIYRTRMMLADGGELIVLAPGVKSFGEDSGIDALIRKYGYCGTPRVLELLRTEEDLAQNLSAAAHLIHGSSEGRFSITYCTKHLSAAEITGAGYLHADFDGMVDELGCEKWKDGWNKTKSGEDVYYISRPGLGLWSTRERFTPGGARGVE